MVPPQLSETVPQTRVPHDPLGVQQVPPLQTMVEGDEHWLLLVQLV
jgi:hypothetical protein